MPVTDDDTRLLFSLPAIDKKKITAAFGGGRISSDGGIFLLTGADKRLGLIDTLARAFPDTIPKQQVLGHAEFSTIRLRLLKVAVRIRETASRIRLAFAANCPDAELLRDLIRSLLLRPA